MKKSILLAILLFVSSWVFSEESPKAAVLLQRKPVKGLVFYMKVHFTSRVEDRVEKDKNVLKKDVDEKKYIYEAKVHIKEVSEKGLSSEEIHEVLGLTMYTKETEKKLLVSGDAVVFKAIGKQKFVEINGKKPEDELFLALATMNELNIGGPTYDDLFGSTELKKQGDQWPAQLKYIAATYQEAGVPLQENQTKGSVEVLELNKEKMKVKAGFEIADFPLPKFPKENLLESSYRYQIVFDLPIILNQLAFSVDKTTVQTLSAVAPDKEFVKTRVVSKSIKHQFSLVPGGYQ